MMQWKISNEPSDSDLEREEHAYQQLLIDRPGFSREAWDNGMKVTGDVILKFLFERRKEPPCVSQSYFRYLTCLNAFKRARKNQKWEFNEEEPETHAEPFSLAYMEYWYERTYGNGDTKESDVVEGEAGEKKTEAEARVVPKGVEPTDIAPLMSCWWYIADGEEVEEGEEPFQITIPASRDITKVLAGPDELERHLAKLSDELCGSEGMVFCRVGDIIRPTTLFTRLRADVDATSPGVQWRFLQAWNTLCLAAAKAVKEDISIMNLVADIQKSTLLVPTQDFTGYEKYKDALDGVNKAEEESRLQILQASRESERMARLCAAHHREMARLADEVSAKLLDGDISIEEKFSKLASFVEKGDPAIPISRPSARARVAELRLLQLGADLVRDIIKPESGNSASQKTELIQKFVFEGDDRLPYLTDIVARLRVVEEVWSPAVEAKSKRAVKSCTAALAKIREEVEKLREELRRGPTRFGK
ncbi:hypothetical protein GL218_06432 [Daldinia childiae]|uniref:uncharacterized protein n=1 Tax=Daldinia childiae TaxID=326645 RepID=UPI0014455C68|nr:uncharacterized protein GL218_06432 [Daldinia childiae]KAF3056451.1 hypothetical protein GL218_06432 [Daldinia childiae]